MPNWQEIVEEKESPNKVVKAFNKAGELLGIGGAVSWVRNPGDTAE